MTDEQPESDIRRRAAWLLGMLALVAALFVTLMVTFFNSSGGDGDDPDDIAGPTGVQPTSAASGSSGSSSGSSASRTSRSTRTSVSPTDSASGSSGSSGAATGATRCPADAPEGKPCALDSDVGNALAAINDYRKSQNKDPVTGGVGPKALDCAMRNGSGCTGGWAETQLAKPDGALAVQKIKPFGKLLSDMKSIQIGWAYDPDAKQYYFAIVREV